jgi:hypothetical protein
MKNKDVEQLAKELFIKTYQSGTYLTDQSEKQVVSRIKDVFDVAKLFYKIKEELDEKK